MLKKITKGILIPFFILLVQSLMAADNIDSLMKVHDYAPDPHDSIILQRIKTLDYEIDITFNDKVRRFIDYFVLDNRDYTRKILSRKNAYFHIFEEALKRHNMPDNLKYLVIVESGINPTITSPAGALGFWQFMPATGKFYGLDYNYFIDERMDPYKSTEAACKYLKALYGMFGDWEMALASYNCGPGNVRKAIRRSGYKKTFWEVYNYLPRETRSYVPQFMAFNYVMNFAAEHNLYIENELRIPKSDTVHINQYFNIAEFAKATNLCEENITILNTELKRNIVPSSAGKYTLNLPVQIIPYYKANRDSLNKIAATKGEEELLQKAECSSCVDGKTKVVYRVKSGDVLGTIAQRYGVRVSDIRLWNGLSGNTIRVGQYLKIYTKSTYSAIKVSSTPQEIPSNGIHVVRSGDTLWGIARSYEGLTVEKLKELNNISGSGLSVGQRLRVK